MANYGPPGASPEPWRGRGPDEEYEAGRRHGWDEPGSRHPQHGPGQPYADPYRRAEPSYDPGTGYGSGPYRPADPGYPNQPGYAAEPGYAAGPYRPAEQSYASYPDVGAPAGPYAGEPVAPPERRRSRGPLIAVLAAVLVLVLGGGAAVLYLLGQDDAPAPTTAVGGTASATAGGAEPTAAAPPPSAPAPEASADPRFVKAGQCVRNEGTPGGKPKLLISDCAPKTYEVLRRFDGATSGERDAEAKCAKVTGYTNWYFFDSELDTLDFVLCLKQR